MLGQAPMLGKLPELAVNRHEVARAHQFSTSFISSMLACPETCTGGFMLPYSTSAPGRAMWSIMRKMPFFVAAFTALLDQYSVGDMEQP